MDELPHRAFGHRAFTIGSRSTNSCQGSAQPAGSVVALLTWGRRGT
jgi:hypothetical protein